MNVAFLIILLLFSIVIYSKDINIGFLFPKYSQMLNKQTGFNLSGGVVALAFKTLKERNLLNGYNFNCYVEFDECYGTLSAGKTLSLINEKNVSIIFGPTCIEASIRSTLTSKFFNIPSFVWGMASTANIINTNRFSSLFALNYAFPTVSYATLTLLEMFEWKNFAFVYATNTYNRCKYLARDFQKIMSDSFYGINLVFSHQIADPYNVNGYDYFLKSIKDKSRIIVSCFDIDHWKRRLMLAMYDNKMNTDEYVLIIMDLKNLGVYTNENDESGNRYKIYQNYSNKNDKRDKDAYEVAKRTLFVDLPHFDLSSPEYGSKVLEGIKGWPFYCNECYNSSYTRPAAYASYLYDAIILWASILNKTLPIYGESVINNSSIYKKHCEGEYFGMTGALKYTFRCLRMPIFYLYSFDKLGNEQVYMSFVFKQYNKYSIVKNFSNPAPTIFQNWGNKVPLNVPECGYTNNQCLVNIIEEYKTIVIVVCILLGLLLIVIFGSVVSVIRKINNRKKAELNKWMIPYIELSKNIENSESFGSQVNLDVSLSNNNLKKFDRTKFCLFTYMNMAVVGEKHDIRLPITKTIQQELNYILNFNSPGLNKFHGFSMDGPEILSLWKYCRRGNLFDFLQVDYKMYDTFFGMSLIRDLINGLSFIHNSPIEFHGSLTSKNCIISDHWQLKISNFDFKGLRKHRKISFIDKLWVAPEFLKNPDLYGSQKGDIYSFGIIVSEIISRKQPWNIENRHESVEELIYLIGKGGAHRPKFELHINESLNIDSSVTKLINDCIGEDINRRPIISKISQVIEDTIVEKSKNLMDHVFHILEEHSFMLKKQIEDRTFDLSEEKTKIDVLLKKMLPNKVVQCLKIGKNVEPENFECVTAFFADIVKFTLLSAKCSPFQVINLVNDLYSQFDNIIEELDVYKVETIGDGYLCVSGLPERNGNLHGREIALLSLRFMNVCRNFTIPHLLDEKIMIRIGCNTGPCVAGVVGLSMPRYCLFGDTINIASRMESNGKAGKIHISESYYHLLQGFGNFLTEPRGEIIIKGKGVMETYWLKGMIGGYNDEINNTD